MSYKQENKLGVNRSRSPKKIAATKWRNSQEEYQDLGDLATTEEPSERSAISGAMTRGASSKKTGFENVASRALEQAYARDVLPHPYFHRDYFEITEVKLLQDRKTFQLWYRPKPTGRVTAVGSSCFCFAAIGLTLPRHKGKKKEKNASTNDGKLPVFI